MRWWLGSATQTTASVIVHNDANATATLTVNGAAYTDTIDTGVNNGLVRIDVSGLSAGARLPFTLSLSTGQSASGTLKTQRATGNNLGFFSCSNGTYSALPTMGRYDLDASVTLGDLIYPEQTIGTYAQATNPALYWSAYWDQFFDIPGPRFASQCAPFYMSPEDHDLAINDLRWNAATFETALPDLSETFTDQMMRDVVDVGGAVWQSLSIGNPGNTDAGVDTNPWYYRFYLGDHAEVFVLSSCMWGYDTSISTRLVRPNYGAGVMLGANQTNWLLNALAASTRPIKIILANKMTHTAEYTNPDGWVNFFDDLDDGAGAGLLHEIEAASGWAVPGGVIWGTGDYHTPSVHETTVAETGYDHAEVCACPSGRDVTGVRDSGVGGTYSKQWLNTGKGDAQPPTTTLYRPEMRNWGLMEIAPDGSYVDASIITSNGQPWWKGRVYAGENRITYPDVKIA